MAVCGRSLAGAVHVQLFQTEFEQTINQGTYQLIFTLPSLPTTLKDLQYCAPTLADAMTSRASAFTEILSSAGAGKQYFWKKRDQGTC